MTELNDMQRQFQENVAAIKAILNQEGEDERVMWIAVSKLADMLRNGEQSISLDNLKVFAAAYASEVLTKHTGMSVVHEYQQDGSVAFKTGSTTLVVMPPPALH